MIIEKSKYRFKFIYVFIIVITIIFLFRLAQLQIIEGEKYKETANSKMLQKITIPAERGKIYTSEGYTLATSRVGYSVEMYYNQMDEEKRNQVILRLTSILDRNQEEYEDEFPIVLQKDGSFVFTYELEEQKWKREHNIPIDATARKTIDILRKRYYVKENVNDKVALEAITKVHLNESIPISLDPDPIFTFEKEEKNWKEWYRFKKEELNYTAEQSFNKLRKMNKIGKKYTKEDARKILLIREKIKSQGFRSWEAVEIANDVKQETMAEITAHQNELPGVSVNSKPIRSYPEKSMTAHVLGYISKVNEEDVAHGEYKMQDLKGAQGMEGAFESQLKGKDGEKLVVTDHKGIPQNDFEEQEKSPVSGNNLFLTIDYDLQKTAEESLERTIKNLQKGSNGRKAPNAKSGAVVVLDVNTGAVLAMASYPTYDPNLFSKGISTEDWDNLNILSDDPLYPRPLYNNATMSALPPGSIFKMVTGTAGLEEKKVGPREYIYDGGQYPGYDGNRFRCWLRSGHGNENMPEALKDSCNVYFYEVGNRVGIDKIEEYARKFGLGSRTGIEIGESTGNLATKNAKEQTWMYTTSNYIRSTIGITGNSTIIDGNGEKQEAYTSYAIAKEIFDSVENLNKKETNNIYALVAEKLQKYGIRDSQHIYQIYQYVLAGKWTQADTLNTSIGQGSNSLTPIQMANYVATLVNGGKNYKVHLVEKITNPNGGVIERAEPKVRSEIKVQPQNLEAIKQGMKMVTMPGGTGAGDFAGFPHEKIGVGAKTGSAQYGSEETDAMAWYAAFAPYEKPEIAVVTMIVQGHSGGYGGTVVRDIMNTYFGLDQEEKQQKDQKQQEIKYKSFDTQLNE